MCEEGRGRVEEECRVLRGKVADLEREHQAARLELNSQVDELKLKVWRHLARGEEGKSQFVLSLWYSCTGLSWREISPDSCRRRERLATLRNSKQCRVPTSKEAPPHYAVKFSLVPRVLSLEERKWTFLV